MTVSAAAAAAAATPTRSLGRRHHAFICTLAQRVAFAYECAWKYAAQTHVHSCCPLLALRRRRQLRRRQRRRLQKFHFNCLLRLCSCIKQRKKTSCSLNEKPQRGSRGWQGATKAEPRCVCSWGQGSVDCAAKEREREREGDKEGESERLGNKFHYVAESLLAAALLSHAPTHSLSLSQHEPRFWLCLEKLCRAL